MPTILGVNLGREFLGGPEFLEKQGPTNLRKMFRHQISLRNLPAIFLKFAGQKKSPQIGSAEPWAQ